MATGRQPAWPRVAVDGWPYIHEYTGSTNWTWGISFLKKQKAQSQSGGGVDLKEMELSTLKIQCVKFSDDYYNYYMFLKSTVHFLGKHWIFRAAFSSHPYPPTLTPHTFSSLRQVKAFHRNLVQTSITCLISALGSKTFARACLLQDASRRALCAVCATLTSPCHLAYQSTWRGTCCLNNR